MSLSVAIRKNFGSFQLDVAFESDGAVLGFLGASGCGKSMTLRCIAGIEKPDEGRIVLNGRVLFDSKARINLRPQERRVGYLFQNYGLFPNMTLEQNIRCGLCREKDKGKREQMLREIIERMVLRGLEGHRPSQLSGGQQQRTALARILVSHPEILLLDEPFSALDAYLKLQLETEMKQILHEFGRDAILVSHSRDEIYRLCGDVAIMDHGHLLGKGDVRRIFADPGSRQGAVLTGCKNIESAEKTGKYEVYVPRWGMHFTTDGPVRDHLCAIGIRAHYFSPEISVNRSEITLVDETEEPFEWIEKFRYVSGDTNCEPIWWRLSKDARSQKFPRELGIEPKNIMLLYE
ncbi:MAG: ATP-binding cassette domain-containing protein [Clostridiales bacterium]|nr:ATP-binding cassette domain-containing protein [Clostridiales bacterium]